MEKSTATDAFSTAYARLNPEQKKAVDTIEGPVMVIAGPGTGKTQILTLRIANILRLTDTAPENILALTFTDAGTKAMRERLRGYIGSEGYRVPIQTFHGFAKECIGKYPDAYDRVIGGRPASDLDKISILESIIESTEVRLLRPHGDPSYYIRPVLSAIESMKKEYITPDTFATIIASQEKDLAGIQKVHEKGAHKGKVRGEYTTKEKAVAKNKELLFVYRSYQALLTDRRLYDFDDMILETIDALEKNEDMLRDLQETYQYIHADEHQDVNGSQNRILELLASYHDQPNIFVVGDEKQAIFRFQGASLENFLYFEDIFSKTKTIALTQNYRSGQKILDAAHSLIAVQDGPLKDLRVPLTALPDSVAEVDRRDFSHQAIEDTFVVNDIKRSIAEGVPASEIAVIVRTNREVEEYAEALRRAGIAAHASAEGDILLHPITQAVQALMDAAIDTENESALFTVLHGAYWGLTPEDLVRIASARSYSLPLTKILSDAKILAEIGVTDATAAENIMKVLTKARQREVTEAPHRVLECLLTESGFITHVMNESPFEGVRTVRRLYDEVEEMVRRDGAGTLREVQTVLAKRKAYLLPLNAPYIANDAHAVEVMTAHKSKGLEFEAVYIPHLSDNVWGGRTHRNLFDIPLTKHIAGVGDALDDERRLLYVAMTRAKSYLHLSYAETNADGRELTPSRLFEAIDQTYVREVPTEELEKSFEPLAHMSATVHGTHVDAALLRKLLLERGLSATHLNNYLESPWNYFFRNMLRIPEVQAVPMQYGTAVHSVLERATKLHSSTGAMPTDTDIKKFLEQALGRLPLTNEEYVRQLERGLESLYPYITHLEKSLTETTKEEFGLKVVLSTGDPDIPEIPLTGKLDRLDFDAEGKLVKVIDYKTGKPKTRGDIAGTTKTSDGKYKRQLVFYTLLLSLYDDERYLCRDMTVSFVEPDSKGVIHEETFTITDEEIESLKQEVIQVAKEISSGSFLGTPCDPKVSKYCHLASRFQKHKE